MDFTLPEDVRAAQAMFRDFVKNEVEPIADKMDKEEYFPHDVLQKAAELGMLGVPFPEEYGGTGLGMLGYCVMNEELAYSSPAFGTIVGAHVGIAAKSIHVGGTPEQKEKYLKPMSEGKLLGAFALTEPTAGSDAAGIKTTAKRTDGGFLLNGSKIWITNGGVADVYVVYANLLPSDNDRGGVTAFIVEKSFPGFKLGAIEHHMGIRGSSTAELFFEDCVVPEENLLGNPGMGFAYAMKTLDGGRLGLGAGCVGMAQRCMHMSQDFAKQRVQFGQPIIKQQAIQFKLADMATQIEAARLMVYQAAWMDDNGMRITKHSAMVKLFCSQMCNQVAYDAVQVHGGMGYMTDYPVERFYRDARITEIYEGTSEIQKVVIAMQLQRERR